MVARKDVFLSAGRSAIVAAVAALALTAIKPSLAQAGTAPQDKGLTARHAVTDFSSQRRRHRHDRYEAALYVGSGLAEAERRRAYYEAFNAYSDCILAAIEKISNGTFEGRSSLKTYLYQIFHNKCVDLIRKNATNKSSMNRTESISEKLNQLSDKARSVVQLLIDKADWGLLKLVPPKEDDAAVTSL